MGLKVKNVVKLVPSIRPIDSADALMVIGVGTAKGLKFPKESKDWGYIVSYTPDFTFSDVAVDYKENIRAKLNNKEKQGSQVKEVVGLPTLS